MGRIKWLVLVVAAFGWIVLADGIGGGVFAAPGKPTRPPKVSKPRSGQNSGNNGTAITTTGSTLLMGDQVMTGTATDSPTGDSGGSFSPASLEDDNPERLIRTWGGVMP